MIRSIQQFSAMFTQGRHAVGPGPFRVVRVNMKVAQPCCQSRQSAAHDGYSCLSLEADCQPAARRQAYRVSSWSVTSYTSQVRFSAGGQGSCLLCHAGLGLMHGASVVLLTAASQHKTILAQDKCSGHVLFDKSAQPGLHHQMCDACCSTVCMH